MGFSSSRCLPALAARDRHRGLYVRRYRECDRVDVVEKRVDVVVCRGV